MTHPAEFDRTPEALADACLAAWMTPSQLQMRHDRGDHDLCPVGWCEYVTPPGTSKGDERERSEPTIGSVIPSGQDQS